MCVQPVETTEARRGVGLVCPVQVAVVPEAACEEEEPRGIEWLAREPRSLTPAGRSWPLQGFWASLPPVENRARDETSVFVVVKPESTAQVQKIVILETLAPLEGAGEGLDVLGRWAARPEIHPCILILCYINSDVPSLRIWPHFHRQHSLPREYYKRFSQAKEPQTKGTCLIRCLNVTPNSHSPQQESHRKRLTGEGGPVLRPDHSKPLKRTGFRECGRGTPKFHPLMSHRQGEGKRKWLLAFVLNGKDGAASPWQRKKEKKIKGFHGTAETS